MIAGLISSAMSLNPFLKNELPKGKIKRNPPDYDTNLAFVGKTRPLRNEKQDLPPSDISVAAAQFPDLANFKPAPQGSHAELNALQDMCSKLRSESEDCREFLDYAQILLNASTFRSPPPEIFGSEQVSWQSFVRVALEVTPDKHPGFPACRLGATKSMILNDPELLCELYEAVCVRIWLLSHYADAIDDPVALVLSGLADPCCISIKHEAVKLEKFGRVLNSVSLVTEIIERLIYSNHSKTFKDSKFLSYSAIGVGFSVSDSDQLLSAMPPPCATSDVPAFDSSCTEEEAMRNARTVMHSYGFVPPFWQRVMLGLEKTLARKLFVISDGSIFEQTEWGMMPTGRYQTSGFNTKTRARRSYAATLYAEVRLGLELSFKMICAGDDALESPDPVRQKIYDDLGLPLRDFKVKLEVDFCSHIWTPGKLPVGQRMYKSLYKLLSNDIIASEQLLAYIMSYRAHPDFQAAIRFLSEHRPEMKLIIEDIIDMDSPYIQSLLSTLTLCAKKKPATKRKPSNMRRTLKGRGDYSSDVTAVSDLPARLEAKIDHLEKSLVKATPSIRTGAATIGRTLGNFVNQGDLGALAGESLAKLFGHGDYVVKHNSLMSSAAGSTVPTFARRGRGTRVTEREFVTDILSGPITAGLTSTAFTNQTLALNPTNQVLFPWLSSIAKRFDQWDPHGIVLEFVSTSSSYNGASQALGAVVMATDYDSYDAPYASKQSMENADYSCSTRPAENLMHGVECDPKERPTELLYTSASGSQPTSFTTLGNFQIATVGCSAANVTLGELWVSYDITFYKKQLEPDSASYLSYLSTHGTATVGQGIFSGAVTVSASATFAPVLTQTATNSILSFPPDFASGRFMVVTLYSIWNNETDAYACTNCNLVASNSGLGAGALLGQAHEVVSLIDITAKNASFLAPTKLTSGSSTWLWVTQVADNFKLQ